MRVAFVKIQFGQLDEKYSLDSYMKIRLFTCVCVCVCVCKC